MKPSATLLKCEEALPLKELDKNPLFHLSMSSLELFHSNFIYWLSRQFPENRRHSLFAGYCTSSNPTAVNVLREKGNVDLIFEMLFDRDACRGKHAKHFIVVENKFKSFPTSTQLLKYQEKYSDKDSSFILLALSKSEHWQDIAPGWRVMNYGELAEQIRLHSPSVLKDNTEGKVITDCYVRLIEAMHKLFHDFQISDHEPFLHDCHIEYGEILRDLRFQSFIEKRRAEQIAYLIWKQIKTEFSEAEVDVADFSTGMSFREDQATCPTIFASSGLTRAQAIIDLKYRLHPKIALGVQIQGNQYRHMIEGPSSASKEITQLRTTLSESPSLNWFDLSDHVNGDVTRLYPKNGKDFNKYGETFFYRSYHIQSESIHDIIHNVVSDMKWLNRHQGVLQSIVS